jgi:RNA polymerase sigma-70 factor (ECF subfamily)
MQTSPERDRATLNAIAQGERQALADLYQGHAPSLMGYLTHLTGDPAAAEDLVQELFMVVWQDAGRFRSDSTVRSWLFGIGHKLGLMWLRRKRPQLLDHEVTEKLADDALGPADLADFALDKERLEAALASLSAEHRAVIELTFYHQLSRAEVAQTLGCPVGTVKSRLHYALRILAGELAR